MTLDRLDDARYRFGFILSTLLGNQTRYQTLRKYSDSIRDVECVWAPVRHYYLDGEKDPVRYLPSALHTRAVVIAQSMPVIRKMSQLDAVLVHQFEISNILAAVKSLTNTLVINAHDNPPVLNPEIYPLYPEQLAKSQWRRSLRLKTDIWAARRSGYFIGFSDWSANIMVKCGLHSENVEAQHVGLDLDIWRRPDTTQFNTLSSIKLLFVGGDFERKGGKKLLDLFASELYERCSLTIVTKSVIKDIPPNCVVFNNLDNSSSELLGLYKEADVLVLPTEADLVPWVVLEAMASSCAVIVSDIGGIPDLVSNDCAILIDPYNVKSLRGAIVTLINDPMKTRNMGIAGRLRIEKHFNAATNVPRIFEIMKRWVDRSRNQ